MRERDIVVLDNGKSYDQQESQYEQSSTRSGRQTVGQLPLSPESSVEGAFLSMVKAMTHDEAGIKKRVSEPVYPADFLSDTALERCSLIARGAWFECLLRMWRDKTYIMTATVPEWSRIWRCSEDEAIGIVAEFERHKPCEVTRCHADVTLMSRRLMRRETKREQDAKRQKKHRSNTAVTAKNDVPSVSSSPSISSSKDKKDIAEKWNALASKLGLQTINKVTDKRLAHYRQRLRDYPDFWSILERELPLLGEFACGVNDNGWKISFDYCVESDTKLTKLAEGKFRDNNKPTKTKLPNRTLGTP